MGRPIDAWHAARCGATRWVDAAHEHSPSEFGLGGSRGGLGSAEAGHAISYAALEEWAELGIGGAILPASQIRRARSAALFHDDKRLSISYEAVWRKDLLVAEHTQAFAKYLRNVVPRLSSGSADIHRRG